MKAEIKGYHSPDIYDLENHKPEQEDSFCFLLTLFVGSVGGQGEESFDFVVCTPKYLIDERTRQKNGENTILDKDGITFGRGHIIVFEYDFEKILNRVKELIDSAEEEDWGTIGLKLSRYGFWEFDDYKEYKK